MRLSRKEWATVVGLLSAIATTILSSNYGRPTNASHIANAVDRAVTSESK